MSQLDRIVPTLVVAMLGAGAGSLAAGRALPAGAEAADPRAPGSSHGADAAASAVHESARTNPDSAKVRVVLAHQLPRLDGARLAATLVEVSYGPGGSSPPHSHPCPVVGYVIEGALRSQVGGGPDSVYTAGQSFYEPPNSAHVVSANASAEDPVRFLAFFTCDRKGALTTPLSSGRAATPK